LKTERSVLAGETWHAYLSIHEPGQAQVKSVFERYAIVSQTDIRDAITKLETGQQREKAKAARDQKAQRKQFGQKRTEERRLFEQYLTIHSSS